VNINVTINVYRYGILMGRREGHNVWVDRGRQYLAELVGYQDSTPTPERSDRLRFMGLGIGSEQQTRPDLADAAPLSTSYPAGFDPNATNGHEYRKSFPIDPPISTLERPVRITGGSNPYATAAPTDVWLIDDPDFFFTHQSLYEATVHGIVDCTTQLIYSPFTAMPLSEVGLFTDEVTVGKNIPYSTLVGYYSFDTILVDSTNVLEFIWRVRFA
jgi:hypothetical protein